MYDTSFDNAVSSASFNVTGTKMSEIPCKPHLLLRTLCASPISQSEDSLGDWPGSPIFESWGRAASVHFEGSRVCAFMAPSGLLQNKISKVSLREFYCSYIAVLRMNQTNIRTLDL